MELEDITRMLELDIVFGRLRPRERLVEDELIARTGAKRHQVRSALAHLESLGIVERRPNRGATVRDFSPAEVEELYEMRGALHRLAVERMDLPFDEERLARLREIQDRHDRAVREGDLETVLVSNNAFHDVLFDGCNNRYIAEAIRRHAFLAQGIRSYRMADRAMLEQARAEHVAMIAAGADGNRQELATLCVRHIEPAKRAYLEMRGEPELVSRAS